MFVSLGMAACTRGNHEEKTMEQNNVSKKVLVAYFSATGTTEIVAKQIAEYTGGDLVKIESVQAYTNADLDWNNPKSRSSVEMNDSAVRPSIKPAGISVDDYDVVFLGYPIWWDLAPRVVNTFIESLDLEGKTIVPFATSGGSGINNSVRKLKATYPSLNWAKGRLLNDCGTTQLRRWIDEVNGSK